MELEITPAPTPEERAAIEQALAAITLLPIAHLRTQWWTEGVLENVLDEQELDARAR